MARLSTRRIPEEQEGRIYEYYRMGNRRPGEIHDRLLEEFGDATVSKRTIRRIVNQDLAAQEILEQGRYWTTDDEPEAASDWAETRLVLDMVDYVTKESENSILGVTRGEAKYIKRLRTAYPDMPFASVWYFATYYSIRELIDYPTERLDHYLASRPWERGQTTDFNAVSTLQQAFASLGESGGTDGHATRE